MVKRKIISIDEEKCNGCGNCVTGCKEGALQIIDGKAKLVNEHFCDGFGDCIGECPTGALTIEERETEEFDLKATIEHVKEIRGENAAKEVLKAQENHNQSSGCPGSKVMTFPETNGNVEKEADEKYQLQQWPIQIDLLPLTAPYYDQADLLLTADCVPPAYGDFYHLARGKTIAMGCPKLDDAQRYVKKMTEILKNNDINSITIIRMEVPCCGGLEFIARKAVENADVDMDINIIVIGINGKIKND